jgi:hypothetical protein
MRPKKATYRLRSNDESMKKKPISWLCRPHLNVPLRLEGLPIAFLGISLYLFSRRQEDAGLFLLIMVPAGVTAEKVEKVKIGNPPGLFTTIVMHYKPVICLNRTIRITKMVQLRQMTSESNTDHSHKQRGDFRNWEGFKFYNISLHQLNSKNIY